jgi:hypothetical protein
MTRMWPLQHRPFSGEPVPHARGLAGRGWWVMGSVSQGSSLRGAAKAALALAAPTPFLCRRLALLPAAPCRCTLNTPFCTAGKPPACMRYDWLRYGMDAPRDACMQNSGNLMLWQVNVSAWPFTAAQRLWESEGNRVSWAADGKGRRRGGACVGGESLTPARCVNTHVRTHPSRPAG